MINYLPFKDVVELRALCEINQPDKDEMGERLIQDTDNIYPATADEMGVARWEKNVEHHARRHTERA